MPEQKYLSTDPNAGEPVRPAAQSAYLSTDPNEGEPLRVVSRASAGSRFGESFVRNVLPSTRAADYIEGPKYAVQHPIDSLKLLGSAMFGAHADQAGKTLEAGKRIFTAPNFQEQLLAVDETLGHGLATAIPLIGPAAANAGEQFAAGDIAGGFGSATGLLTPTALSHGYGKVAPKIAGAFHDSALKGVEKAINPTRVDTKAQTARIAPEILKRRVTARNLPKLEDLAETKSAAAGAKVDQALEPYIYHRAEVLSIVEELEKAKQPYIGEGQHGAVVNDKPRVKAISNLQDTLMEYGDYISVESMRKLRQNLDEVVEAGKGFTNPKPKIKAWAAREGRAALRDELSKAVPDLDKVNAEYSFWQTLEDVTHASNQRKTGQKGNLVASVAGGAGAIAAEVALPGSGLAMGGLKAAIGAKLFSSVRRFVDSPGYQLWSAVQKERLADALMGKDTGRIQGLLHAGAVATSKGSRAAGRLQSGRPIPKAAEATDREPLRPMSAQGSRQ